MLTDGGNAVDAAITTTLCQGIMNPQASGLGGGTIMVIRAPNGTTEVIDAREVAPAAATQDMFKGDKALTQVQQSLAGCYLLAQSCNISCAPQVEFQTSCNDNTNWPGVAGLHDFHGGACWTDQEGLHNSEAAMATKMLVLGFNHLVACATWIVTRSDVS